MRTALKILAGLLLLAVLALGGGFLYLKSWLAGDGAAYISSKASLAVGKPVKLTGLALEGVSLVKLERLELGDPQDPQEPHVVVGPVTARVALGASLSQGTAVLEELTVGQVTALVPSEKPPPAPPRTGGGGGGSGGGDPPVIPLKLRVGPVEVRRKGGAEVAPPLRLEETSVVLDQPSPPRFSLKSKGSLGDGAFTVEGSFLPPSGGDVHLAGSGLSLPALAELAAAWLPPGATVEGAFSTDLKVALGAGEPQVHAMVLPQAVRVWHPKLKVPVRLPQGTVKLTPQSFETDLPVELGALRAKVDGEWVPPRPEGKVDFKVRVKSFGLDKLEPFFPEEMHEALRERSKGQVRARLDVGGTRAKPEIRFAVEPRGLEVRPGGKLPPVTVEGKGLLGTPEAATVALKLASRGLAAEVKARLEPLSLDGKLNARVTGKGLPLGTLLQLAGGPGPAVKKVGGELDLDVSYQGSARVRPEEAVRTLKARLVPRKLWALLKARKGMKVSLVSPPLELEAGRLEAKGIEVRTPLGKILADVDAEPFTAVPRVRLAAKLREAKPLVLVDGLDPELVDARKSVLWGRFGATATREGKETKVVFEPLSLEGRVRVQGATRKLWVKAGGGGLEGGRLRLPGLTVSTPGARVAGDVELEHGSDRARLGLDVAVEPGKLSIPGLPQGLALSGALRGRVEHDGPLSQLSQLALALRPDGVQIRHPALPVPVAWSEGAVELSSGGLKLEELALGLGDHLRLSLEGSVSPKRLKLIGEFQDWAVGRVLALAGKGLLPAGVKARGKLGGRIFYGGGLPKGGDLASLIAPLAVRLKPAGLGVELPGPTGKPLAVTVAGKDLVMKKGAVDLGGVKLVTPLGEVSLKGAVRPLDEKKPYDLAFHAPRLEGLGDFMPAGTKSSGFMVLDGKVRPVTGGTGLQLRVRPRGLKVEQSPTSMAELAGGALRIDLKAGAGVEGGVRAQVKPEELSLRFAQLKQPLRWSEGRVRYDGKDLILEGARLRLGKSTGLVVDGRVKDPQGSKVFQGVKLGGTLGLGDLQPAFGLPTSRAFTGTVNVAGAVTGDVSKFAASGKLTSKSAGIVFKATPPATRDVPISLSAISIPFRFEGTTLSLEGVSAGAYGGALTGGATFRFTGAMFAHEHRWSLKNAELGQFMAASLGLPGILGGKLSTILKLTGQGPEVTTLVFTSEEGTVTGFNIQGTAIDTVFPLSKYVNYTAHAKKVAEQSGGGGLKGLFKGFLKQKKAEVIDSVVDSVDGLAEYREHLRALITKVHRYPDVHFKIHGPPGTFLVERFWVPDAPGLFEGNAAIQLGTLALHLLISKMNYEGSNKCRLHVENVQVGGTVDAPTLVTKDFWKRITKVCPAPPPPPPPPTAAAPSPATTGSAPATPVATSP